MARMVPTGVPEPTKTQRDGGPAAAGRPSPAEPAPSTIDAESVNEPPERTLGFRSAPVRRVRMLLGDRAQRRSERAFVVEGLTLVADAIASGAVVEALYVAPEARRHPEVLAAAEAAGVAILTLEPGVMERIADTVTPQPVLAIVGIVPTSLAEACASEPVLVLAGLQDPGNVGTILRTAQAAGIGAVVALAGTTDLYAPKVVRASGGALLRMRCVADVPVSGVIVALAARGFTMLGADTSGRPYDSVDLRRPLALFLGGETHGLPDGLRVDELVAIPMAAGCDSLNVAVAAGILCFEIRRQRHLQLP